MTTKTSPFSFGSSPSYGNAIRSNPKNIPTAPQNYSSKGTNKSGPFADRDFVLEESPEPTSGTGANFRVVYHRRTKRKNGTDKINMMDQRGLVMFTQKENGVESKRPKFQGEDFESMRLYTMLNLPALNNALEKRNLREQTPGFDKNEVMTVEMFAEKVYCEGVVTSERGGESNQINDSYGDRLINNVIFGKAEVFNHWGSIVVGSKLFFIIKRAESPKGYNLDGSYSNFTTREKSDINPIQVIPWTKKGWDFPTMQDREYKDHLDRTQYGKVIYFGKVEKISPSAFTEKDEKHRSVYDVGYIVNQALISVLIQPKLIA